MDLDTFRAAREQLQIASARIQELAPGWPFIEAIPASKVAELVEALWAEERASEAMREALVQ